jgi:outer membrane murein-binding lipoprotein Lpp
MGRVLLILATIAGALVVAGCSSDPPSSSVTSAQLASLEKQAAMYQLDQIEVTWHKAASTKDLDLMMTLWAANATFQVGLNTYTGTDQLRTFWSTAAPFQTKNHWVDETPAYKAVTTVSGNTGTIYFECHFVDVATNKLVGLAATKAHVADINGRWVITSAISSQPVLSP